MKPHTAFEVGFKGAASAVLNMSPGHVEPVDRDWRKVSSQVNVLRAHAGSNVEQSAGFVEAEKRSHPVHQVFGGLDVIRGAAFPESEIQVAAVKVDVVFYPARVEIFHLAFVRGGIPA